MEKRSGATMPSFSFTSPPCGCGSGTNNSSYIPSPLVKKKVKKKKTKTVEELIGVFQFSRKTIGNYIYCRSYSIEI